MTIPKARLIQETWRQHVVAWDDFGEIHHVAGVDVGIKKGLAQAAVVVLRVPELSIIESAVARVDVDFPYVPGYLSFREVPAILQALRKIKTRPDLILCDGQGYAHPRRFGLACHLGVWLDRPTIGVAKSRLIGSHSILPESRGSWRPLRDRGEVIGAVVRTRDRVKPLYVSIGHRVNLQSAIDLVLQCCTRYRLPETTRAADRLASGR